MVNSRQSAIGKKNKNTMVIGFRNVTDGFNKRSEEIDKLLSRTCGTKS